MYFVKQGNWKVVNKNKEDVLTEGFNDVKEINGENIIIVKDNKYGIVDVRGNEVLYTEYEYLSNAFSNNYIAKKNGKYGIVDSSKNVKLDFVYESIVYREEESFFEGTKEGIETDLISRDFQIKETGIVAEVNDTTGYIRVRVADDYKYYNFKFEEKKNTELLKGNTLFLSKQNDKYGFADKNGNVVVDYIYDDATEQNDFNFAAVKKDGLWGSIDKTGKVVDEIKYNLDNYYIIDFIGKWHLSEDLNMYYYTDAE